MQSQIFDLVELDLAGKPEVVLAGGRHLFPKLPEAFKGIATIGVIGWGPQGSAQAQNLRDSLVGTGIKVVVGLRKGSKSFADAQAAGFSEAEGTLGEMFEVIPQADLCVLLIADAALVELHEQIFAALKPGAIIGLSHGFLLAHLQAKGTDFPAGHSVIAVCPKGMGASVRRLYEQGVEVDGAGINTSVAVHRDVDGRATDVALGWAVGIGAPYTFETTLASEYKSDISGERAILLGLPHAIAEAMYTRYIELGDSPEKAFQKSTESMTGPLAQLISHGGLKAVLDQLSGDERAQFDSAYSASYKAVLPIIDELYDEVSSGNEINSVVLANKRLEHSPMPELEGTRMWKVGQGVRARRDDLDTRLDPTTAGVFCGAMVAQIDLFEQRGHEWSEIVNESVIEAVDSLIPYMHARGLAYMIDNCSTTARLGARKWAPRFEAAITQQVIPALDGGENPRDPELIGALEGHKVHGVLDTLLEFRPSVDIAVL